MTTRYIILDRTTHEPDWDGTTHATREEALESLCGALTAYVRTPEEEDDTADDIRTYWERDYRICEIAAPGTAAAIEQVRAVHTIKHYDEDHRLFTDNPPAGYGGFCQECGNFIGVDCRTIRALDTPKADK